MKRILVEKAAGSPVIRGHPSDSTGWISTSAASHLGKSYAAMHIELKHQPSYFNDKLMFSMHINVTASVCILYRKRNRYLRHSIPFFHLLSKVSTLIPQQTSDPNIQIFAHSVTFIRKSIYHYCLSSRKEENIQLFHSTYHQFSSQFMSKLFTTQSGHFQSVVSCGSTPSKYAEFFALIWVSSNSSLRLLPLLPNCGMLSRAEIAKLYLSTRFLMANSRGVSIFPFSRYPETTHLEPLRL